MAAMESVTSWRPQVKSSVTIDQVPWQTAETVNSDEPSLRYSMRRPFGKRRAS